MTNIPAERVEILKSQFVISSWGGRRYLPYAFTEQGDVQQFNKQYEPILLKNYTASHDRFLIIAEPELYHIGASLKDLGKKWFSFSKLDMHVRYAQ